MLRTSEVAELTGVDAHRLSAYVSISHGARWIEAFPEQSRRGNVRQGVPREWSPLDVVVMAMLVELAPVMLIDQMTALAEEIRANPGAASVTLRLTDTAALTYSPRWDLLAAAESRLLTAVG